MKPKIKVNLFQVFLLMTYGFLIFKNGFYLKKKPFSMQTVYECFINNTRFSTYLP